MSAISLKSITGITSITTPAGIDNQLTLHTNNTTERLRISSDGKIGIGTDSPDSDAYIHIVGPDNGKIILEDNDNNGANLRKNYIGIVNSDNLVLAADEDNSGGSSSIRFRIDNTEKVRIVSNGRVGFGTDSPQNALHVSGASGTTNSLRIDSDSTMLAFYNHSQFIGYIGNESGRLFINAGGLEDTLSIKTNGNERFRIDSKGQVSAKGSTTSFDGTGAFNGIQMYYETDSGVASFGPYSSGGNTELSFHTNSGGNAATEKLRIDSNGRVSIAHNALRSGNLQVYTAGADAIDINSYSTSADNGGRLTFYRSKNASIGSNTIVANDDSLGRIDFRGFNSNGNSYNQGATIEAKVSGAVDSTTDMPTAILFKTSGDGSASPDERLRITPSGNVGIGTAVPQGQLHVSAGTSGDCRVYLEADEDNNDEGDNAFIVFKIDGGNENAAVWCGNGTGGSNDNSLNLANASSVDGGIRFFTSSTSNGWESAPERARITTDGRFQLGTDSTAAHAVYIHTHDNYQLYPNNNIGSVNTVYVNTKFSGSDALTANSSVTGMRIQLDYDGTSGTGTNGERKYVYAMHGRADISKACYDGRAGYFFVTNTADNQSFAQRLYGVYGYAQGYSNGGSNKDIDIYGGYFLGYRGGTVNDGNVMGIYARAHNIAGGTGNTGTMTGGYFECEQDQSNTIDNMYGVRSYLDRDSGTITNSYLFYGSHAGDSNFTNRWGIYISDSSKNYLAGTLQVTGSLSKGGGGFRIPHPLPALGNTKDLVHSFVEGPQCDNLYRGKVDLVNGTASVNIDTKSGMTEGTFVALNRDVQCFTTNETGWTNVKGSVTGNILTIIAQDNTCTDTISWMVIGERKDDTVKSLDITDRDGYLIVEPDQEPEHIPPERPEKPDDEQE